MLRNVTILEVGVGGTIVVGLPFLPWSMTSPPPLIHRSFLNCNLARSPAHTTNWRALGSFCSQSYFSPLSRCVPKPRLYLSLTLSLSFDVSSSLSRLLFSSAWLLDGHSESLSFTTNSQRLFIFDIFYLVFVPPNPTVEEMAPSRNKHTTIDTNTRKQTLTHSIRQNQSSAELTTKRKTIEIFQSMCEYL